MSDFTYNYAAPGIILTHPNEGRADWGESAIKHGSDAEAEDVNIDERMTIVEQDISDTLANVMHFCARAGIDFDQMVYRAENAVHGDLEDGPEAERDYNRFPKQED